MDHKSFLQTLNADEKAILTRRSDAAGLRHLAGHLGLIMTLGALIAFKVPFWGLLLLPQGIALAFLFTLQHEATHKTPFATERLNETIGHLIALLIAQPFTWFRYFHLAHHKHTQDPAQDPELAGLPKPDNWPSFFYHLSSLSYWRDKVVLLLMHAGGKAEAPYLPKRAHTMLKQEARVLLACYALAVAFSVFVSPLLFWVWLAPLALGFPVLRLYLLAEHGRCPNVENMLENSRTTYTGKLVNFLAWNMPYHAEHHSHPQVPFYLLPRLNSIMAPYIGTTSQGYRAFAQSYTASFKR
ncbi:fatty acid desaturase [Lentibacter sp.]|uniref:fatty acid desaturase n=1 Tax=Lentibacter sp. TaxID=2024994 RepID=UPI003F697358